MKKYIIYLVILAVGLFLGSLLFGEASEKERNHNHEAIASNNQKWTCSMHTQIMHLESGDCPICGMDLIPVQRGSDGLLTDQFKLTENAMALANIKTSIVGKDMVGDSSIKLSGKMVVNKKETATQPSHFNGRIEKLYINSLGQRVKMGQAIAQIYSPELIAAQQELITSYRLRTSQPELYKAVRNKFKNWKIHDNQLSIIEKTGQVTTRFTIYSHVSGVVSEIIVNEGAHIMDGHSIFEVTNLATIWAEFDAYENQISQLEKGMEIKVKVNAYPNKEFDAVISFIDPILNNNTRTVTIRATLNNKENLFKPGMFVTGQIKGETQATEELLIVPASAILWTGERSLVYVKLHQEEAVFEMREVTIGLRKGENYVVTSGLEKGDEIVTNGTFTVDAAAQLQGKKSMMNKSSTIHETSNRGRSGNQENFVNSKPITIPKIKLKLSKSFQSALKPYLKMEDAFVDSNVNQVSILAKETADKLKDIKINSLGNKEKYYLLKSIKMLSAIASNLDLKKQRAYLIILNENMVALAMDIKSPTERLYVIKCPMANNNKGAIWLSKGKQIKNPYYGENMLTCGSLIEEIN